jgi:hypothetical protein
MEADVFAAPLPRNPPYVHESEPKGTSSSAPVPSSATDAAGAASSVWREVAAGVVAVWVVVAGAGVDALFVDQ